MTNTSGTGKALRASFELDEQGAAALARLADRYADDLPAIQQRDAVRVPAVVHAVFHHQARRLLPNFRMARVTEDPAEEPEDRAEDVADALSLLQTAREDLDSLEAALLYAARRPGPAPAASPC